VCQSDCSGIGWPKVREVININADPVDVQHYNRTTALIGDAGAVLTRLTEALAAHPRTDRADWHAACAERKEAWTRFKAAQYAAPRPHDPVWGTEVLTQPQAIKTVADFCAEVGALKFFDAGDVQANGFQIVEDNRPFETFTETGASYMGFAVSALLAAGLAETGRYGVAFSGDGSFMMSPQVLLDAVEHGVHGTIVLFDNRRMAAISSLQEAQYGQDFRTSDGVAVDYVALAAAVSGVKGLWGGTDRDSLRTALTAAHAHTGLSLVHVPVYYGSDPAGGMGAYGQWNVGAWCDDVQRHYTETLI
jgi:3D-(3,5/4)-trihydroxycyclohexane-1,2-dione acylhydrolase (decyclizing)